MQPPIRALRPIFRATLGLCAALAVSQADAGIVFNWVTASTTSSVFAVQGRLEVANALWSNGTLRIPEVDPPGAGGVLYGCRGSSYVTPVGLYPGCTALTGIEDFYFNVNNRSPDGAVRFDSLRMQGLLTLLGTQGLAGSIAAETSLATVVRLASGGPDNLWTILTFQSDLGAPGPTGCYSPPYCTGATGRWVLDTATIPVPEPATLGLAGAALLAAWGAHQVAPRRQRRTVPPPQGADT